MVLFRRPTASNQPGRDGHGRVDVSRRVLPCRVAVAELEDEPFNRSRPHVRAVAAAATAATANATAAAATAAAGGTASTGWGFSPPDRGGSGTPAANAGAPPPPSNTGAPLSPPLRRVSWQRPHDGRPQAVPTLISAPASARPPRTTAACHPDPAAIAADAVAFVGGPAAGQLPYQRRHRRTCKRRHARGVALGWWCRPPRWAERGGVCGEGLGHTGYTARQGHPPSVQRRCHSTIDYGKCLVRAAHRGGALGNASNAGHGRRWLSVHTVASPAGNVPAR